ncbi:MAG: type II toxin-antitoxin system RelE/ParE family toxin [Candidatus Babeliales bacterium]
MQHAKMKKVIWRAKASKQFLKLPRYDRDAVIGKIDLLASGALNLDIKKLKGYDFYRLRVGTYRVIYQLIDGEFCIVIIGVGHRKQVYDDL